MSSRYFIDHDDSRIFVKHDNLKKQIQNVIEHVKSTISYSSIDDDIDEVVYATRKFVEDEHNAVFLGSGYSKFTGNLPNVLVFDTQTDFIMFMLRWS